MKRKEVHIKYDPDIYLNIQETGRLVKIEEGLPHLLSDEEAEQFENKKIGPTFVFTSKYVFDTTHLGQIVDIHMPIGADSYKDHCKENILTLKFYKINRKESSK